MARVVNILMSHQVPCAVWSCQVTLNVGVEDLDRRLDETAPRKMLIVLDKRQPGLQQFVIGLHVDHIIFVQLRRQTSG